MSILDKLPHTCVAKRKSRTQGTLGGGKESYTTLFTGRECWQQAANDREITEFMQRGISVTNKVYFTEDPQIDARDVLIVTNPHTSTTMTMEVKSRPRPDASVGMGIVWRVFCEENTTGGIA